MRTKTKNGNWVNDITKYSANVSNPVIKTALEMIERLHSEIQKLWWNAMYMEDPEEANKTREFLRETCSALEITQECLLKYQFRYLDKAKLKLVTFGQIREDYYLRLKDRGLMI